jgi:hypothetical protein
MSKKLLILIPVLALFGQGCINVTVPSTQAPGTSGEAKTEPSMCADTPQVHFFNKLAFSSREITEIQASVVAPLVEYYEGLPGYTVVSIMIKRTESGINVEAIVDQADAEDPVYHGFVHPRVGGGYPMWYPEEVPPEYRG